VDQLEQEARPETNIQKAQRVRLDQAAEKALQDPIKLRWAARMFRHALARGMVDRDGNILSESNGERAAS
jgi:hypothetical protein